MPERLARTFRAASEDPPLYTLARALAHDAPLRGGQALLVARSEPTPILAAIGTFDAADEARLDALHEQLERCLPRTVYLSHLEVERACERLAHALTSEFGREEIATMRFVGVPRGGLVVLGLLAYALALRPAQLGMSEGGESPPDDAPLVVVDDVAISGLRMAQFLAGREGSSTILATLFSHPDLRDRMLRRETRLRGFVSAHDLTDHAPRIHGERYDSWLREWERRADPRASWVGEPDHVCFPWSEPETSVWNSETGREERGWNLIPPELCAKHRGTPASGKVRARRQERGPGPLRAASPVVYGIADEQVVIGHSETGDTFLLEGSAAEVWRALLTCGDVERAAARLAGEARIDVRGLAQDVHAFAEELLAAGLLEREAS